MTNETKVELTKEILENIGNPVTNKEFRLTTEKDGWVSGPVYKDIMRLKVTCGGGIGGASWYEYVEPVRDVFWQSSKWMEKFKRWDGRDIFINVNYIVKAEMLRIAQASYESTYNPTTGQHRQKEAVYTKTVLVEKDETVELIY